MNSSLRRRLVISLMVGVGLPLLAAGLCLGILLPSWFQDEFDVGLATRARALIALTDSEDGEVEFDFEDEYMPEFETSDESFYFEMWVGGRELLERSHSFYIDRDPDLLPLSRSNIVSDEPIFITTTLPDGRQGRQVQVSFVPEVDEDDEDEDEDEDENESREEHEFGDEHEPDEPLMKATELHRLVPEAVGTVLVAGGTEHLDATVALVRAASAGGTIGLLALLSLLIRFSLDWGLRPVRAAGRQMAAMSVDSLDQRLSVESVPAELAPFVENLNHLLNRLQDAFTRERQLTADMAHELKTPIAELRTLGEVGSRLNGDPQVAAEFYADAKGIARQMERVVAHLLDLARHDAGRTVLSRTHVNLAQLVRECWLPVEPAVDEEGPSLLMHVDESLVVDSDADKLRLILTNLLDNAISYGRPGSPVEVLASPHGTTLEVQVANFTDSLEEADLEVMFERFWRKDEARSACRSAGLGLSLVRAYLDSLEIPRRHSLEPNGRFVISLELPLVDEATAASSAQEPDTSTSVASSRS